MRKKKGSNAFTGAMTNENGTRQYYVTADGKQGVRSPMSPTGKREDGQMEPFMRQAAANKMYELLRMGVRKGHFLQSYWQEQVIWTGRHEKKKERLYDRFKRKNISKDMMAIAMTPAEYLQGGLVVGATWVSWGTLPMIGVVDGVSDIRVGELEIDANTTIGELSKAIVAHNGGWAMGDRLSFIYVRQGMKGALPIATPGYVELWLKEDSEEKLWQFGRLGFASKDECLAIGDEGFVGGYCWVHGGWRDEKWQVSEQRLIVESNRMTIERYTSEEQWQRAADGYREQGEKRDKARGVKADVAVCETAMGVDMDVLAEKIKMAVKEGVLEALREWGQKRS